MSDKKTKTRDEINLKHEFLSSFISRLTSAASEKTKKWTAPQKKRRTKILENLVRLSVKNTMKLTDATKYDFDDKRFQNMFATNFGTLVQTIKHTDALQLIITGEMKTSHFYKVKTDELQFMSDEEKKASKKMITTKSVSAYKCPKCKGKTTFKNTQKRRADEEAAVTITCLDKKCGYSIDV